MNEFARKGRKTAIFVDTMSEEKKDSKRVKLTLNRKRSTTGEAPAKTDVPTQDLHPKKNIPSGPNSESSPAVPAKKPETPTAPASDSDNPTPPPDVETTAAPSAKKISLASKRPAEEPENKAGIHEPDPPAAATRDTKAEHPSTPAQEIPDPQEQATQPPKTKLQLAPPSEQTVDLDENTTGIEEETPETEDKKKKEKKANEHNSLASILIILVLLGILGGSAYGIWFILMQPSETTEAPQTASPKIEATSPPSPAEPNTGAITKAKEAIEKIPTAALDQVLQKSASMPPEEPTHSTEVVEAQRKDPLHKTVNLAELKRQQEAARRVTEDPAPETATPGAPFPVADPVVVEAVKAFLGSIHIGGFRSGANPKVMIGGTSYLVGEMIDPRTGLSFDGLRDGKLAFKDKNGVVYLKSF